MLEFKLEGMLQYQTDNIKQEMKDEKMVKAEGGDISKEEKKESPTKEEQPKDDKKETSANVKKESKGGWRSLPLLPLPQRLLVSLDHLLQRGKMM